jgi:hypothetical protein
MPAMPLDQGDAAELAEDARLPRRLAASSEKPGLDQSLAAFVGHPAYGTEALRADLHRFAFSGPATAKNSSPSQRHDQQH